MQRRNSRIAATSSMEQQEQERQALEAAAGSGGGAAAAPEAADRVLEVRPASPDAAAKPKPAPARHLGHVRHGHLRVPVLNLEVRPELVAISMGESLARSVQPPSARRIYSHLPCPWRTHCSALPPHPRHALLYTPPPT